MEKSIILRLRELGATPVAHSTLQALLTRYARPNDKIADLLRSQWLLAVRRGLYLVNPHLTQQEPEPALIANHLLGPSYVSQDYALAWHGLIPESVHTVTSVALNKTNNYSFHRWHFSYLPLPQRVFSVGVAMMETTQKQTFLMATPTKALCDKLWLTTGLSALSKPALAELLLDDWRIDEVAIGQLEAATVQAFIAANMKRKLFENLLTLNAMQGV
jgi:phage terminase large subunit-like protein